MEVESLKSLVVFWCVGDRLIGGVESTQRAIITFERPSAARTALLLQDAQLGKSKVHVTSSVPLDETHTPPSETQHQNEVSQEDKPRTAVLAE